MLKLKGKRTFLFLQQLAGMRKSSDEKGSCRRTHRRRLVLFFVICTLLLLFKAVLMIIGDDGGSDSPRQGSPWERRDNDLTTLLLQSSRQNPICTPWNFTERDFRFPQHIIPSRANPHLKKVQCEALFHGDKSEQARAHKYMDETKKETMSSEDYIKMTEDCDLFRKKRGYIMNPLSKEEYEFPLAFSILFYKNVAQIERLLRSIYMPQNYYCLHIDLKAKDNVHLAVRGIAKCFPNVFVASRLESVFWGHISIIYAEMNCLNDLLLYSWKYFMNLSGQMFPLHTNGELVKILKLYDGANDIEGTYVRSRRFWLVLRQTFSWRLYESLNTMMITIYPKGPAPHNATIYKGSNQVAITREFAEYLLYSKVARDLLEWFKDTLAPDEYIWPTLNHNPALRAPGGFKGDPEDKAFTARVSVWLPVADQMNWSWKKWDCQGQWVREICIFGIGDMPFLYHRPELFANKLYSNYQWLTYDCLEELHFKRTMQGDRLKFDPTYYENLPIVKHKDNLVIHASK